MKKPTKARKAALALNTKNYKERNDIVQMPNAPRSTRETIRAFCESEGITFKEWLLQAIELWRKEKSV